MYQDLQSPPPSAPSEKNENNKKKANIALTILKGSYQYRWFNWISLGASSALFLNYVFGKVSEGMPIETKGFLLVTNILLGVSTIIYSKSIRDDMLDKLIVTKSRKDSPWYKFFTRALLPSSICLTFGSIVMMPLDTLHKFILCASTVQFTQSTASLANSIRNEEDSNTINELD